VIVVAGEALVDLVIGLDGSVAAKLGGGPFNVARTIARLGGSVGFLGSISRDRFGERLVAALTADGVRDELILRTDAPTTLAAAELDDGGAASYRFYLNGTSAPALDHAPPAPEPITALHLGTLGLVLEPMATTLEHYTASMPADVMVVLDPNCRERVVTDRDAYLARVDRILASSHVVKISTDDAVYLAPSSTPRELAHALLRRGAKVVLVTAGSAETVVVGAQGEIAVPIPRVDVVDTIGAGDSFGGAFLASWTAAGFGVAELDDLDAVARAAAAANEVAGRTCQRAGADPPRRADLAADWGTLR
jgi:fructokinase